eukprot:CAMPEP_0184681600 /NCGR_PEP_ID=MMETSP0312-20130426/4589_1 /TAXON_ID=31354 /ORGANISM="Compsopogon coeruleus, Strain SAG 36.94" /LENGTH=256 /DNA_ID=CAMNT_0027132553 /DNA_START=83 /DNA_END=850 /DNA_ORIENTATION=-
MTRELSEDIPPSPRRNWRFGTERTPSFAKVKDAKPRSPRATPLELISPRAWSSGKNSGKDPPSPGSAAMDEGGPQRRKLLSPTASPRMNLRSTYVDETLGAQPTFQLLEQQPTFEMDNEDSPLILDGQVVARGVGLLNFPRKATFRLRDATLYGYAKGFTGEVAASASLVGSNVCERPDGKIKIDFADGTELTLAPTDATQTKLWLEALKKASMRNIERYYRFGGLLGEGKFGKVHMGYRNETGEPVAIKVMAKSD